MGQLGVYYSIIKNKKVTESFQQNFKRSVILLIYYFFIYCYINLFIIIINYKIGPSLSTTGSPSNFRIVGSRFIHSALQFASSKPSDNGLPTTTRSSRDSISTNRLNSDQSLMRLLLI